LGADVFIADVDRCAETGEVDIDPVGVFGNGVEEAAVAGDAGVDWIVESIGIAGLVEGLIFMWGEIDLEIAIPFGGVGAVAGQQAAAGEGQEECGEAERVTAVTVELRSESSARWLAGDGEVKESRHGMVFIILSAI